MGMGQGLFQGKQLVLEEGLLAAERDLGGLGAVDHARVALRPVATQSQSSSISVM